MYKANDVTNWLSQTTDNSKYFVWSPGLWDKESRLYIQKIHSEWVYTVFPDMPVRIAHYKPFYFSVYFIGPVALSTPCKLIAPGVAINGLMSITKTDMYFEMDEEDEGNKKIDPKVGNSSDHV